MYFFHRKPKGVAGVALAATLLLASAPALAINVQINGNMVGLNPPPIERAGRVFVPLRGIFEQMGATVVYSNGQINATRGRRTVSLTIGSTQATVDGQPQNVDVAPFIIGASTYVPLRFISQALGSQVNWDESTQTVALTSFGVGGPQGTVPLPPQNGGLQLLSGERPRNGAVIRQNDPRIVAQFAQNVDPNSLRIRLDGVDITAAANPSQNGFSYLPPRPLQPGLHTVRVRGRALNGNAEYASWTFTTGTGM